MPTVYDVLSRRQRLALAVAAKRPAVLAQTFAALVGQFYDRTAFDALAREAAALYADDSAEDADRFRAQLNRRLWERQRTPIVWEVDGQGAEELT